VAELRESGGKDESYLQASSAKEQPEIWDNDDSSAVAVHCIEVMMQGEDPNHMNPNKMEWRGDYLCLKSRTSLEIPEYILKQAFHRRNIQDEKALATGMRLYRSGGPKKDPVLVLAPQKPQMKLQAAGAKFLKPAHVVYKTKHKTGLLESVLRVLSHTLKNEEPLRACPQPGPSWHQVLDTTHIKFEDIPKILLDPVTEILDPANCCGITSILQLVEHVVVHLGLSQLFVPYEGSRMQDMVIMLGSKESTTLKFQQAIKECRKGKNDTPRVLAVSILCSDFVIDTEALELDAGKSESILYKLGAFIVFKDGVYTSHVKDPVSMYYIRGDGLETTRRQWRTTRKELIHKQALLLYYQDRASSPSDVALHVEKPCAPSSSQLECSKAKGPELCAQSGLQPQLPTAASEPAKEDQIDKILARIQVCSSYRESGPVKIAQCAAINLPYDANLDLHLDSFRREQMDSTEREGQCFVARDSVSQNLIVRSLAIKTRPEFYRYQEKASWVFIDELCAKLRTSTGFTHSLQSLELDPDKIKHAFNKPPATPETCYSRYIANRGMTLMEAVKHHNDFYKKKNAGCLIQALQVPDITGTGISYSNQFGGCRKQKTVFKQTAYAHLLHGMLAGMNEMQELVIYLPVSADERDSILQILCGL
jgi:hypothetical protein